MTTNKTSKSKVEKDALVQEKPNRKPSIKDQPQILLKDLTYKSSWDDFQKVLEDEVLYKGVKMTAECVNWGKTNSHWSPTIPENWRKGMSLIAMKNLSKEGFTIGSVEPSLNTQRQLINEAYCAENTQTYLSQIFNLDSGGVSRNTLRTKSAALKTLLANIHTGHSPDDKTITDLLKAAKEFKVPKEFIKEGEEFPPMTDEFVSEFGYRCYWILENWLAPMSAFLNAWKKAVENGEVEAEDWGSKLFQKKISGRNTGKWYWPSKRERVFSFLVEHFTKPENHFPIPDFEVTLRTIGANNGVRGAFKPSGENTLLSKEGVITCSSDSLLQDPAHFVTGIRKQFGIIQTALYFITGLLSGPRVSEIRTLSASQPVMITETHAVFNTKTFKLCSDEKGEDRPWVIPTQHGKWIQTFFEMRHITALLWTGYNPNCFWTSMKNAEKLVGGQTLILWVRDLSKSFGLSDPTLSEKYDDFINHSFRKTIARYIAIAMIGGHKYLFDMFGHKWFEMTLHYIYSKGMVDTIHNVEAELKAVGLYDEDSLQETQEANKSFAELVEDQRKELVFSNFMDILTDHEVKHIGGGVEHLRNRASELNPVFEDLSKRDLMDLSANGSAYIQISEEVACLKDAKSRGRCSDGKYSPNIEPGKCHGSCQFHVATDAQIRNLEKSIRLGVEAIDRIIAGLQPSETIADYAGDLRRHALSILKPIEQLKGYDAPLPSTCDHELVRELLEAHKRGNFMEVFGCE